MTASPTESEGADNDWPSIPLDRLPVIVGRDPTCTIRIIRGTISQFHCRIQQHGDILQIVDTDSTYGVFVNNVRVRQTPLRLNDMVRFGSSPPYRVDGALLRPAADEAGISLTVRGLSITRRSRIILDGIDFHIPGGTFVGVLGPSGVGKSLLLGCLSSTISPTSGSIEFDDGRQVLENLDYYRSKVGFVPQQELIFEDLTVTENLTSAARIRIADLPKVTERVADAIRSVNLVNHAHKAVSLLSGGEKRRVSIAVELLLRPRLLILDEPTSGLDPLTQVTVMSVLRTLARQGVTVVCTTHTLDTIHFFDSVLVLGKTATSAGVRYAGDQSRMLPAFGVVTTSDLFEKLQAADGQTPAASPTTAVIETRTDARVLHKTPATSKQRFQQLQVVARRSMLSLINDRPARTLALGQPVILALLILFSQTGQSEIYVTFFEVLSALWLGMTLCVRELVRERQLYVRDRLAGLDPMAYLGGKVLFAIVALLPQSLLLWATVLVGSKLFLLAQTYQTLNGGATFTGFLGSGLMTPGILWAVSIGGGLLAFIVSAYARTERAAVGMLPLLLIPQMLFSSVGYGDGANPFNADSPFGPIVKFEWPTAVDSGWFARVPSYADVAASLVMITRPGQWSIVTAYNGAMGAMFAELLLLLIVIAVYAAALHWTFIRLEPTWTLARD